MRRRRADAGTADGSDAVCVQWLDIVQIRRWTEEIRKTTAEDQKEAARIIRRLLEEAWIVTTGNQTAIEMDRDCFDRIRDFRSKMAE